MDTEFQKDFLRDLRVTDSSPAPVLALFGKHPAWNDDMEDFGLSTASLRTCKRLLYLQGIAANAARQQSEAGVVQPYRHFLLWVRGCEALLIRMVESGDGRGPFLAAVHFDSAEMQRSLRQLLPALRSLVDQCLITQSREALGELHRQARDQISAELQHLPQDELANESSTTEEFFALRGLGGSRVFMLMKVSITRHDQAQAFAALSTAWRGSAGEKVLLIAQADPAPSMTLAANEPGTDDFWFLRKG